MSASNHQRDSEVVNTVTPEEARIKGIRTRNQPPESTRCQFCGKTLQPMGLVFQGEVYLWRPPGMCDCPKSREIEEQRRIEAAQEKEREQRREMKERILRLLSDSGLKKRFANRTFANFRRDTAGRAQSYEVAKSYADHWEEHKEKGDGLYIEGTNGTGKTHLAAAIALQLIGEGVPVICKTGSDLLTDIKRSFDNPELQEHQILDVYRRVDLLIVDDLGKEQCSDWSMSTLYSIFNDRYEDMKPTIITTNYNADGLVAALTPKGYDDTKIVAIVSRLRETSTVLTMAWQDIRGR